MMNERILELFEQALKEFNEENKYATIIVPNPLIEKFAQLIVRECMNVCLEQSNPLNLNYKPSERFAEVLRQHFGVEK